MVDIIALIVDSIGVIFSIFSTIFDKMKPRDKQRISLHKDRKDSYDFFKNYIDDWVFYRDKYSGKGFYPQPLNTAFNGFAKEAYKKDPRFNEQLVLAINNGYTAQFEELNDIHIYFKLKDKDKKIIDNLIESMKNYYASILNFYYTCKNDRNNLDASVDCLENSYKNFFNRIREADNAKILDKMDKSLQVK